MKIIMLGAPGAGKGTQAKMIAEKYGIPHVSTGDIFRANIKNGTELGMEAKKYMDQGQLVPDDVTIGMLLDRISQADSEGGYVLDGFPRTIPQAQALLDSGVDIDKVLDIEVPDEAITKRMSGRRVCSKCANSYHVEYKKPKVEGVCDACGGELIQRKDDAPETVLARLAEYHQMTEPLKDFYKKLGKLTVVEGQEEVADTTALVYAALED